MNNKLLYIASSVSDSIKVDLVNEPRSRTVLKSDVEKYVSLMFKDIDSALASKAVNKAFALLAVTRHVIGHRGHFRIAAKSKNKKQMVLECTMGKIDGR